MNAVIFDMDGVIFDTERIWIECWSPVGQAHNIEGIEKILRDECVGITAAAMKAFVKTLDIPKADKERLAKLSPATYTGLAEKLVRKI